MILSDTTGFVYVLWTETLYYKIGMANNPADRLPALRGVCNKYGFGNCAFTSWFKTPYMRTWESFLHAYFKDKKVETDAGREWFLLDTHDIDLLWSIPDNIPVHPYSPDYWQLLNAPESVIEYAKECYANVRQYGSLYLPDKQMSIDDMRKSIINANSGRPGDK